MKDSESTLFAEGLPPIHPPRLQAEGPTFYQVFKAWEILRLFYNAVMAIIYVASICRIAEGWMPPAKALLGCGGIYFLIVNVPFCLCHVFEVYLCWLGMRRWIARVGIFVIVTSVIGGGFTALIFLK